MKKVIKYLKGKFKRVSVYSKSNNNITIENTIEKSIIGNNNKNNKIG